MELPLIAAYDKKLGLFDKPFVVRLCGEAIREWEVVIKDTNTKFGKNPEDFELYQIGIYNDSTGDLQPSKPHIQLA